MNNIPEAAIEAGAAALRYEGFRCEYGCWCDECDLHSTDCPDITHCQECNEVLRSGALVALEAAMPAIREQIAAEVSNYWDACGDLIDSHNGARLAFDAIITQIREGDA